MQDVRCRDAIGKWDFGAGQVWGRILKEPSASSVFILSERLIMLAQEAVIQG